MAQIRFAGREGKHIELTRSALDLLDDGLDGRLIRRGADSYDKARQVWNGMVDKRPAAIAYCASESDVTTTVDFVLGEGVAVSVRSGGHNIVGNCLCEDGLVIDLSAMKRVEVDPDQGLARAEAGLLLGEFDTATQMHGLATTMGVNTITGIAGLTLGGGIGRLGRKHGLSCDNLASAQLVTADGRVLTANSDENADLYWALRGGGGNFGIVTRFDYRVWPVGPNIFGGSLVYDYCQARNVLRFLRDRFTNAADELDIDLVLLTMPEGEKVLVLSVCYAGSIGDGERLLAPLRAFGSPLADQLEPIPYLEIQASIDHLWLRGRRYFWKANFLRELTDAAIDSFVDGFADVPSPLSLAVLQQVGGAISRVPATATAFWNRDAAYDCFPVSVWLTPEEDERNIVWARQFWLEMHPHSTGGVYVNNLGDEGGDRVRAAYGDNYDRLVEVKRRYDPGNLFRYNQNIRPNS